jgi:hypothetical protein
VRKLDQLRAVHLNQQHTIRMQVHGIPDEIRRRQERIARLQQDIALRDSHAHEEFSMEVNGRIFTGKGAREAAAAALTQAVLAAQNDPALQTRGSFRSFELLSRGQPGRMQLGSDQEALPELFVRGAGFYQAQLNAESPLGTMQSIEHALRALDKGAADEGDRLARCEKMLADYRAQLDRPFEHEVRLNELLRKQNELNAALDLDKGERQVAPEATDEQEVEEDAPAPVRAASWQSSSSPPRRRRVHKGPTLRPGL